MFVAKNSVIWYIVEESCASLRQSLKDLYETFCAGLNKNVNKVLRAGSIASQFHADVAIDIFTLHLLEVVASDDTDGSTEGENVVDPR